MSFLHGIQVVEVDSGPRIIRTASSSVIGIVGTAPEADEDLFPLNTPTLITGSVRMAGKLGNEGSLPKALKGILDQIGALVVVVRVVDGENVAENIRGNAADFSGIYALLSSKSVLGVTPRILLAPCDNLETEDLTSICTTLLTVAQKLGGIVVFDAPISSDAEAGLSETVLFSTNNASDRLYLTYPQVISSNLVLAPSSAYAAGVIAKTDNEMGFWCSPSNKKINGILGISTPVDFAMGDESCRANYLNSQNITTIINEDGYRLWGNRTTSQDTKYQFLCVRRTADIISESILRSHLWAVDRNIVKNYLTDVTESVNAFLASLKSQGAILDGRCYPDPDLNTVTNIADGKVYFDFEFTPAFPAELVTFRAYLNNENIESILFENLASS